MNRLLDAWADRFAAASDGDRAVWHAVSVCVALYLAIYVAFSQWYIEDAAIVFSYARHLAGGLGAVPWPGGERVEGFSDPTWTALLAVCAAVGWSPWIAAKLLGAAFGAATIPLVARWAAAVRPGTGPELPGLAALLLVLFPQFSAWNSSGLECALLGYLLTRGAVELVEGRGPARVGIWYGLAAITRPEGALYAGVAGLLGTFAAASGGFAAATTWCTACALAGLVPIVGWQTARYAYFAWPLPNTAYAKLGEARSFPLTDWNSAGWVYIRSWALRSSHGFWLPLHLFSLAGLARGRTRAAMVVSVVLLALLLPGLSWPHTLWAGWPERDTPVLAAARLIGLGALAIGAPWLAVGRPGLLGRALAWYQVVGALAFAVYSGGDWMIGFRWLSPAAAPLAVLLADAAVHMAATSTGRWRALLAAGVAGPLVATSATEIVRLVRMGDTTPFEVHDRLRYHERVAVQLGVPVPPSVADVDMGAHQWWWRGPLIDYAGLIDVPFAQHHWAVDFLDAYVYAEQRPDILHCHGAWASKSRLRSRPGYQGYVAIPGYPMSGGALHDGSFVRRDLLTRPRWDGPTAGAARFVGPVGAAVVPGWWLDGDRFAPGGRLPLTLGIQKERTLPAVRVYAFLASGADVVAVWEVPPAYDWLPAERWRKDEVVVTRHLLSLPAALPEGTYDLGLSVVSQRGGDPLVGEAAGETAGGPPRFAQGELVWSGAVTLAAPAAVAADAAAAQATAVAAADADQCERATAALQTARGLGGADGDAPAAIGRCYAREQTPAALRWARRWAPTDPVVRAIGRDLADRWEADGDRAARAGDAAAAHQSWTDALGADPLRPWLRRRVEEARALRLAPVAEAGAPDAPAGGGD